MQWLKMSDALRSNSMRLGARAEETYLEAALCAIEALRREAATTAPAAATAAPPTTTPWWQHLKRQCDLLHAALRIHLYIWWASAGQSLLGWRRAAASYEGRAWAPA